jgi:hypothetical protein
MIINPEYVGDLEPDIELKVRTKIGELTACFLASEIEYCKTIYTGWYKEKPNCIVQADDVTEGVSELEISLNILLECEKKFDK